MYSIMSCINGRADYPMEKGCLVGICKGLKDNTFAPTPEVKNCIGISLHNVVQLDVHRSHQNLYIDEMQVGSVISVLTKGIITYQFTKKTQKNSVGKRVYANIKTGKLTLWKSGRIVGQLLTNLDNSGYGRVLLIF